MRAQSVSVALLAMSVSLFGADEAAHWSYGGQTGPSHWGDLDKENATCKLGKEQSPIDITGAQKADLEPIVFGYTSSPADIVNNGHTVQVNVANGGSIRVGAAEYTVVQFHFHTPSEELINGKTHAMVAHLVHKSADGKLAVVAVEINGGKENAALKPVFDAMPAKVGETRTLSGGFNLTSILPARRDYYTFMGSLTTPPCSEGVRWYVLKDVIEISAGELAAFKKLYPMNARPVQPLNGRSLQETR
jgi:carbonic anhydrase